MPELPEVETIKNDLLPRAVGRCFTRVDILDPEIVRHPGVAELRQRLVGQRVGGLERRGKYLIFRLSSGAALILHLKMSGSLLFNPQQTGPQARAVFQFDDGSRLVFVDPRRFGVMWLVEDVETVVGKLGPEPLASGFTPEVLLKLLSQRRAPIKAVLCDQELIAGIGNMYADEALFSANIHPLRRANSLSWREVKRLHSAIRQVLETAIGNKGASTDTYVRPDGQLGTAHSSFCVAHRGGEPCPVCGTPVERIALRNRGTYFCPRCQPGPPS